MFGLTRMTGEVKYEKAALGSVYVEKLFGKCVESDLGRKLLG